MKIVILFALVAFAIAADGQCATFNCNSVKATNKVFPECTLVESSEASTMINVQSCSKLKS